MKNKNRENNWRSVTSFRLRGDAKQVDLTQYIAVVRGRTKTFPQIELVFQLVSHINNWTVILNISGVFAFFKPVYSSINEKQQVCSLRKLVLVDRE